MKKGMQFGVIVSIVIVLVIFVLAGVAFSGVLKDSGEAADRNACKLAIQVSSAKNVAKLGGEIKGACDVVDKEVDTKDKEEIMEVIAKEMKWCYDYVDRGDADFTSNFDFWFSEQNTCLYCAVISFGDDAKKLGEIDGKDFETYLIENPKGEETYAEFFKWSDLLKKQEIVFPNIDLNENLEVYDFMSKKLEWTASLSIIGGVGGGAALGVGVFMLTPAGWFTAAVVGGGAAVTGIVIGIVDKHNLEDEDYIVSVGYAKSGSMVGKECKILN